MTKVKSHGAIPPRAPNAARAFTLIELAVVVACLIVLIAVITVQADRGREQSGSLVSMSNLRAMAQGLSAYNEEYSGRNPQWHRDDIGAFGGNCSQYLAVSCHPSLKFGTDSGGGIWAYWLGGGSCPASYPGNCFNWCTVWPAGGAGCGWEFGSYRFPNAAGFRHLVDDRFYAPVFYSPNDRSTMSWVEPVALDNPAEFVIPAYTGNNVLLSSYCFSISAMFHPDVFRSPTQGGYTAPQSLVHGFQSPSVAQCLYPDLKSQMAEINWCAGAPLPEGTLVPAYNAASESTPMTLFFDGHVGAPSRARAHDDDALVYKQSGERLWSRDTPLGELGIFSSTASGSDLSSWHLLTTGGITGRDFASAR